MASPMFEKFRTSEIFVANDAWHVAFDHPDAGLRGGLELTFPIGLDGVISDKSGFDHILKHVLDHVIQSNTTKVKPRRTQIILSYKLTYEENDFKRMTEIMFDKYNFSTVCFMSDPSLSVIPSCNNSALILNVGPRVTSAVPIYENIAMRKCSVISNVGGEHVTEFLELLIDGQGVEAYSSLLNRRRRQFARLIKERHVFIASSFPDAKRQYGEFFFEFVKVLANTAEDSSSAIQNVDSSKTEHTKDIAIQESYTLGNGQQITISIDRELFYAGELLFSPVLHEPCENEKSIIEVLLASIDEIDESVREEICKQIIVTGKTSLLSGFEKRLRLELSSELAMRGIFDFEIIMSEEQNKTTSAVWSGADHWIRSVQTSAEGRNILSQEYYQKNGPSSVYQLD
jgi:actin-related protein